MLLSLQQVLPGRETIRLVLSGFTWIIDWQKLLLGFAVTGNTLGVIVLKGVFILLPSALLVAAMWCTMAALYSLPFRLARTSALLTALLMSWWDAGRMVWFYWAGLVRFAVVLLGWVWGLLKLAGSMFLRLMKYIFTRPLALLDWATHPYFQLGFFSTLAFASFGWGGVRAMTWFLFGRFGTPALLGILGRQKMEGTGMAGSGTPAIEPEFWKGPIDALKREAEWFKKEGREVFELLSLPVMQILAAAVNFAVVVVLGHPSFTLPFRNLDQLLARTPMLTHSGKHVVPGGAA